MRKILLSLGTVAVLSSTVTAGPFGLFARRGQVGGQPSQQSQGPVRTVAHGALSTAQGAANYMASLCRIGHFGGNSGYEGVGCGATPQAAEMNCCFRHKWNPREVGIAQGANGLWYACCRY
jgi:hypothetical protein